MASPASASKRILVPVDFSPGSSAALECAVALAEALGASVTLFHVYEPASALSGIVPGARADTDVESQRSEASRQIEALLEGMKARGSQTPIQTLLEPGYPTETILKRAEIGKFDLIVMGTHGRSGLARFVMGSVAEGVVRQAACPVVTMHLPGE